MVLSEAEAEARLADLRRQREALDRAITDLTLYLELGRRLTGEAADRPRAEPDSAQAPPAAAPQAVAPERPAVDPGPPAAGTPDPGFRNGVAASDGPRTPHSGPPEESPDAALSEGVLARRYGRALIQAALAVLEEAGRPMHAGEIEAALSARGFSVPGQQDPVAALNTRLWKRSGPAGPLRRLGEAVYALPESDERGRG